MAEPPFISYSSYEEYPVDVMKQRARDFYEMVNRRRTVRQFSDRPVPRQVIDDCLRAATTAPSGAHMQPWHFAVISNPDIKRQIRQAAEKEEHEFYHHRAPPEWLEALRPLGTDEHKPYLEKAPYLIGVFIRRYGTTATGERIKHYYAAESVGIATGILITALHHAGLATLTHTPSPMGFLNEVLGRPDNERAFVVLVVGYPAPEARVPDIQRRYLADCVSEL